MSKFEKGQSGNPNGRPKKEFTLSQLLSNGINKLAVKKDGSHYLDETGKPMTNGEILILQMWKNAVQSSDLMKQLAFMDRLLKVQEQNGDKGKKFTIKWGLIGANGHDN